MHPSTPGASTARGRAPVRTGRPLQVWIQVIARVRRSLQIAQSDTTDTDCVRRTEMLDRELPGHQAGDRAAQTPAGRAPTIGTSLRAYLLQSAWAHEDQADREAVQRS